jgi:hypothetical protein
MAAASTLAAEYSFWSSMRAIGGQVALLFEPKTRTGNAFEAKREPLSAERLL